MQPNALNKVQSDSALQVSQFSKKNPDCDGALLYNLGAPGPYGACVFYIDLIGINKITSAVTWFPVSGILRACGSPAQ